MHIYAWEGECFFWYWPTQVVADKGPWNVVCVGLRRFTRVEVIASHLCIVVLVLYLMYGWGWLSVVECRQWWQWWRRRFWWWHWRHHGQLFSHSLHIILQSHSTTGLLVASLSACLSVHALRECLSLSQWWSTPHWAADWWPHMYVRAG